MRIENIVKKSSNINQRLVLYCKDAKIKQIDLIRVGIASKQTINNVWHDRYKPSCDFLEKFSKEYEELNTRWLLTGKGDMIDNKVYTSKNKIDK